VNIEYITSNASSSGASVYYLLIIN